MISLICDKKAPGIRVSGSTDVALRLRNMSNVSKRLKEYDNNRDEDGAMRVNRCEPTGT